MKKEIKALFLTHFDIKDYEGVSKKILYQIEALKKLGCTCELCYKKRNKNNIVKKLYFSDVELEKYGKNFIGKLKSIINYKFLLKYILKEKYNTIYIRYYKEANPFFIKFLKNLNKNNIRVILELPTYPYDLEQNSKKIYHKIFYLVERKYRLKMKNYINRIITFSNDSEIFGIKTIMISNGINLNEIFFNKVIKRKENEINFIGVAHIHFWHGFDRLILSMAKYYNNNPQEIIKFHIVGDGDKEIVNNLKKIVRSSNLEEYVIFYGYKSGKDLDEIFKKMDIGVGSLASFRQGLETGSSLKNREYCARGLPILNGDIDLPLSNEQFVYQVPNKNSLFDLNEIIEWYKNLKLSQKEIRKYAEENLTWDKQMKKVVDYILKAEEKEKC